MSWTPLGKAGDLTGRHLAPSPSVHPSPGLQRQRAPRRPGGAAQPPSRSAARRPPPSPPGRGVPAGGGARAAGGGRRARPRRGSLPLRCIRPTKLRLLLGLRGWGGSHGLESRHPSPLAPPVAPSESAGTRGQAPCRREEAASVGRGGAGASAGPRLEGTRERLSRRTKAVGEGSAPPSPGPGPELELVLDILSRRWRGNPSELGRVSAVHRRFQGGGEPALLRAGGSRASPGALGAPQTALRSSVLRSPRPLQVGVRTRPLRLRPGGVGRGPAPALPPRARPAARAAHGRPDSLHVASAAAIQPLIEH